jgi:hypothetical protein
MSLRDHALSASESEIKLKDIDDKLRDALDKNEKLERIILVCQRNANQKAELHDDAVRMVHTVGMQYSDMIKAQIERFGGRAGSR